MEYKDIVQLAVACHALLAELNDTKAILERLLKALDKAIKVRLIEQNEDKHE